MPRENRFMPGLKKTGTSPDNYICTAQMMKEIAGDNTLRFVLICIAKLADIAGSKPDPVEILFIDKGKSVTLRIRRIDKCPAFELDGVEISRQEGENFIMNHYLDFITGYKKVLSGHVPAKAEATKAKKELQKQRRLAAGISSQYVDGKLKVDISTILNNEKEKNEMRREAQDKGLTFADDFFKKEKKRGYVPNEKDK